MSWEAYGRARARELYPCSRLGTYCRTYNDPGRRAQTGPGGVGMSRFIPPRPLQGTKASPCPVSLASIPPGYTHTDLCSTDHHPHTSSTSFEPSISLILGGYFHKQPGMPSQRLRADPTHASSKGDKNHPRHLHPSCTALRHASVHHSQLCPPTHACFHRHMPRGSIRSLPTLACAFLLKWGHFLSHWHPSAYGPPAIASGEPSS